MSRPWCVSEVDQALVRSPRRLPVRKLEVEKLVTYDFSMGDPEIRRRSWQMRRKNRTLKAEPNAAHRAVAELEWRW